MRTSNSQFKNSVTGPTAVLHIGPEETTVVVRSATESGTTLTLAIGSGRTAREHFRHTPPSPLELENAIATVEDEVTRARTMVNAAVPLYTSDPDLRAIAKLAGVPEGDRMQLSVEAIERTFDRLASVVLGQPASRMGLPRDNSFAATLLILREFMHHLQCTSITCVEVGAD